jgi:hypothetical protein
MLNILTEGLEKCQSVFRINNKIQHITYYIVTRRLKSGIVKSEKTVIARQRIVDTSFRDNQLEQSVDKQRLSKR